MGEIKVTVDVVLVERVTVAVVVVVVTVTIALLIVLAGRSSMTETMTHHARFGSFLFNAYVPSNSLWKRLVSWTRKATAFLSE